MNQTSESVTVIEPPSRWVPIRLGEIWEFRDLLYFLSWRDLKVRYKQTFIGAAWAVLQPLLTMIVFTVFFGRLAKIPSDGFPYPVFSFCGLLPWQLFAFALSETSNSLVANKQLVTKVYFPRLLLPVSSLVVGIVDFLIAFVVLIALMLGYGLLPTWRIVFLPGFIALALIAALGVGLWLAALNVKYRDVRYTLPFLTQFWMLATPIAYPSSLLSEKWRWVYGLNPMAGVVEGFRWALLGAHEAIGPMLAVSASASVLILIGGLFFFRRIERSFADLL